MFAQGFEERLVWIRCGMCRNSRCSLRKMRAGKAGVPQVCYVQKGPIWLTKDACRKGW